MQDSKAQDFTPNGLKLEGTYENDRNRDSADLFKAVIREAYGVQDVIVAHHLTYVKDEKRKYPDGRDYAFEVVEEIPSADALIFDHDVAEKIFGSNWQKILTILALEPVATRDSKYRFYYDNRTQLEPL